MAADARVSGMPMFVTDKIFRVNGSLIGGAGRMEHILRFVEWRRNPDSKPTFSDSAEFEILELTSDGKIIWWGVEMVAIPIKGDCYAIGSGANFALGAMSMGASPQQAIQIASKWDSATGNEVRVLQLKAGK